MNDRDKTILRDLAKRYVEICVNKMAMHNSRVMCVFTGISRFMRESRE